MSLRLRKGKILLLITIVNRVNLAMMMSSVYVEQCRASYAGGARGLNLFTQRQKVNNRVRFLHRLGCNIFNEHFF